MNISTKFSKHKKILYPLAKTPNNSINKIQIYPVQFMFYLRTNGEHYFLHFNKKIYPERKSNILFFTKTCASRWENHLTWKHSDDCIINLGLNCICIKKYQNLLIQKLERQKK